MYRYTKYGRRRERRHNHRVYTIHSSRQVSGGRDGRQQRQTQSRSAPPGIADLQRPKCTENDGKARLTETGKTAGEGEGRVHLSLKNGGYCTAKSDSIGVNPHFYQDLYCTRVIVTGAQQIHDARLLTPAAAVFSTIKGCVATARFCGCTPSRNGSSFIGPSKNGA